MPKWLQNQRRVFERKRMNPRVKAMGLLRRTRVGRSLDSWAAAAEVRERLFFLALGVYGFGWLEWQFG